MNIFGVGGMELAVILVIMLVVAGPKRMIQWAYVLGQYTTKLRAMWTETVGYLQKEFDDAGVGIKLPTEPPTRGTLNQTIIQAMKPLTEQIQEPLNTLKEPINEVNKIKSMATIDMSANGSSNGNGNGNVQANTLPPPPTEPPPPTPPSSPSGSFGTWSGAAPTSNPEDKPQ
jgi:Sec-independent protein translocase protein TatA